MSKLIVNTAVIEALNPCDDRFDNWKTHYANFNGDILKFLQLNKITDTDKIWVAVRILPKEMLEVFAIDCAFAANNYADAAANAAYAAANAAYNAAAAANVANAAAYAAAYADAADNAAYAAYAAANAAYAAAYAYAVDAAAADAARNEQVEVLKWLIKDARKAA